MRKLLTFFIVMILSLSMVSAISVISSSQITFDTNDDRFNGPAFVVTSIENDGQDEIDWSMANFKNTVDDEYEVVRSGSIKSDFYDYYWLYPIKITGVDVGAKLVGTKDYLWRSNAEAWCESLNGDYIVKKFNIARWDCVRYETQGYISQFEQGEWNYNLDYIVNIDGVENKKITLTQTASSKSTLIDEDNYFTAYIETMGTTYREDPVAGAKLRGYYRFGSGEWTVLASSFPPSAFNNPTNFPFSIDGNSFFGIEDCFEHYNSIISEPAQRCIDGLNNAKDNYLNVHYGENILSKPLDFSGVSTTSFTGSVKYDDDTIYRNPMVTLTIRADDLVVKRTFGKGEIVDVSYPKDMIIGQTYTTAFTFKNVGDADMDATINLNCPSFSLVMDQRFPIKKGETVTKEGQLTFTSQVTGCEDSQPCVITIMNSNTGIVDDTESFKSEICRPNDCNNVGSSTCDGDDVMQCVDLKGSYVLQKVEECKPGECIITGNYAECETPVDSDYKTCPNGVRVLKTEECPADNTIWYILGVLGLAIIIGGFALASKGRGRGGSLKL